MKTKDIVGLIMWILLWSPLRVWAQNDGMGVIDQLVEEGFVNVRYKEQDGARIYSIENDSYRIQSMGIAKALQIIQAGLRGNESCKVVITLYDVPQLVMEYDPRTETAEEFGVNLRDWKANYKVGDAWKEVKSVKVRNSSRFKVDLLVYPQLAFRNLIVLQIYHYLLDLSPSLEVTLWPGGKLAGMVKIPVKNDGFGRREDLVHPGHLTLSQRLLLPYNIRAKVTGGFFNANRYGLDAQLLYPFKDQRWVAEGRVGYLGVAHWGYRPGDSGFYLRYGKKMQIVGSLGVSFFLPRYNTQFALRGMKWLGNDSGVKFEVIRHYRKASIGFYAEKSTNREFQTNGGFRFQVALPPYKQKRHGYIPRISTSNQMGLVYNAGNEKIAYKEYKAEASDNIMEANSFNPLFIQNELSNF